VPGAVGFEGVVTREQRDAALAEFARASDDRVAASRTLVRAILDPVAREAGKQSWVEKTTQNPVAAPVLIQMFPGAGIVHVVRDGRDVACSIARMPWGPDTVPEAIEFWAHRLRRAEEGERAAPPGSVLVVHLEDLVLLDREGAYERLLEYVGLDDEPAMRSFFDSELTPERAHLGRWRAELDPAAQEEVTGLYEEMLRRLHAEGVSSAPPHRSIEAGYAPAEDEPVNPFDTWWSRSTGRTASE
jgi:sulfotransferase family protein